MPPGEPPHLVVNEDSQDFRKLTVDMQKYFDNSDKFGDDDKAEWAKLLNPKSEFYHTADNESTLPWNTLLSKKKTITVEQETEPALPEFLDRQIANRHQVDIPEV